jgi:hypothetical protein
MNYEINGVTVEVAGDEDRYAVYSACVKVGGDVIGTGRCRGTRSSAQELARLVIESYFSRETPPEGAELRRRDERDEREEIYIVPFRGIYVVARRVEFVLRFDCFRRQYDCRYDWVVETWHTTVESARRAAARVQFCPKSYSS